MNRLRWHILLVVGSVAACGASVPPPVAKQAASQAALERARQAGAEEVPDAANHLQYAEEELENGRTLMIRGDNRNAARVLERARFEADLALEATRASQTVPIAQAPIAQEEPIAQAPAAPPARAIGGGPPPVPSPEPSAEPAVVAPAPVDSEKMAREALEKIAIMGVGSVRIEARGTVISMPADKLFVADSTTIAPRGELELVADALKGPDGHKIVVEGFTDSQGNAASSKELSQRRADAVRELLVSRGVPADRVRAQGLGGVHPIADNGTVAGRTKNNRVEILVQAIEDK